LRRDFFDLLGVDEAILNVEAPNATVTREQPREKQPNRRKKATRQKASGEKDSGKKASEEASSKKTDGNVEVRAEANSEASGDDTADASKFSHGNFLRAANILAKSMKEKCESLVSL
jgi:hypothetical protein